MLFSLRFLAIFSIFASTFCTAQEGLRAKGNRRAMKEVEVESSLNYGHGGNFGTRRHLSEASDLLSGEPVWVCFNFSNNQTEATICNDADNLDMPLTWTGPAVLKITDMYQAGDRFEVIDTLNDVSLGLTSDPGSTCSFGPSTCNENPNPCFNEASMSSAVYCFEEDTVHSINIIATQAPCLHSLSSGFGEAYFQLTPLEPGQTCETTAEPPIANIELPGVGDNDATDATANFIDFCKTSTGVDRAVARGDLKRDRWGLNAAGIFVTGTKKAKSSKSSKTAKGGSGFPIMPPATPPVGGYTKEDMRGCSCAQIVEFCGYPDDFLKDGCSTAAMNAFSSGDQPSCLRVGQFRK